MQIYRAPWHRLARNTVIFSVATGLSRVAGLAREIVASSYFATSGAFSAFTLAFQVPNLVRSLFADAALSAAFVPVFTELLEHGSSARTRSGWPRRCSSSSSPSSALITVAFTLAAPDGHAAVHRRRVHRGARRRSRAAWRR